VYKILNQRVDTRCERVFLPDSNEFPEYLRTNTSLFTLESQHPIRKFDILAFSIYFEEDFLNILKILELAKIPLWANEREDLPLVIGGGPATYINPEPIADFFDLFILGEAEELLDEFIDLFREAKTLGLDKDGVLEEAAKIEGIYVPTKAISKEEIRKKTVDLLDLCHVSSSIITPYTEFASRYLIEVSRGCPRGCRFCVAKFIDHPFRYRSLDVLLEEAVKGLALTKKIGLVGTGEGDYPWLEELVARIKEMGGEVSIGSIRFEAITPELLESLTQWALSLAPEAGNELLRGYLGKELTNDEIFKKVELISSYIPNLKLYFMTGLPQEKEEDIEDLITLVKEIRGRIPRTNLTISISPFVPKPHTPFQWRKMEDKEILKARGERIKNELETEGIRVTLGSVRLSLLQAILARGDRRLSHVLYLIHKENLNWQQAFEKASLDSRSYLEGWGSYESPLPWDHLKTGPPKEFLIDQDRRVPPYRE
ncbi:TPA: radical SAM protein, partial [bacterium]|nr:radical SAM protein [bacterium]